MEVVGHVSGENWRGTMTASDGSTSEVILKDNCMWTWSTSEAQGIKTCFDPTEAEDMWDMTGDTTETQVNQAEFNYNCVPAVLSEADLNPPPGVDFLDLEEMMQGIGN